MISLTRYSHGYYYNYMKINTLRLQPQLNSIKEISLKILYEMVVYNSVWLWVKNIKKFKKMRI